ncbi:hypothetical protein P7K49_028465 [Saguinus oedipus]|uniref:Uncharacterized protein n=1 Tax=Saguinus oedipus TaxID=9490 RepID=A0ABQ9UCD6_SAGOE|nr:hypothetical protein P7K49_028465 [Saguinus oedipus]
MEENSESALRKRIREDRKVTTAQKVQQMKQRLNENERKRKSVSQWEAAQVVWTPQSLLYQELTSSNTEEFSEYLAHSDRSKNSIEQYCTHAFSQHYSEKWLSPLAPGDKRTVQNTKVLGPVMPSTLSLARSSTKRSSFHGVHKAAGKNHLHSATSICFLTAYSTPTPKMIQKHNFIFGTREAPKTPFLAGIQWHSKQKLNNCWMQEVCTAMHSSPFVFPAQVIDEAGVLDAELQGGCQLAQVLYDYMELSSVPAFMGHDYSGCACCTEAS